MLSLSHGTPLRASAGYVLPGSSQPYAAAVKRPQGCNLSRILHFSCVERPSSGLPLLPQRKSGKKYGRTPHSHLYLRYRSSSRISPLPFSSPSLQPLFIMGEKTGIRAKEKACFRTVQDKFQCFRPVVLDLRQKYARLSLSH